MKRLILCIVGYRTSYERKSNGITDILGNERTPAEAQYISSLQTAGKETFLIKALQTSGHLVAVDRFGRVTMRCVYILILVIESPSFQAGSLQETSDE